MSSDEVTIATAKQAVDWIVTQLEVIIVKYTTL